MIKDVAEPTHIHSLTALFADIEVIGLVSRITIDALRLESVEFLAFHEEGLGSSIAPSTNRTSWFLVPKVCFRPNCKASRAREMLRFMEAIGRAGVREWPAQV